MKAILTILFLIMFSGCSSLSGVNIYPPSALQEVHGKITDKFDEFDNSGWIISEPYYAKAVKSKHGMISYSYRASYVLNNGKKKISFIQIYFTYLGMQWAFINKVKGKENKNYTFIPVDSKIGSDALVREYFAINISEQELVDFSLKDTDLKFSGKRYGEVYKLSKFVSQAFYNRVMNLDK